MREGVRGSEGGSERGSGRGSVRSGKFGRKCR